jgi:metallo-beta-lactamase family protein
MKITFHGAAGCVTGSNHLVETENCKFLVDCGMFQGNKTLKENNYKDFPYNPAEIDFVLLTHAHIDHSGLLPKLVKHGFNGPIYATKPTLDLLRYMLPDSAHIQEIDVMHKNRRNERKGLPQVSPIYDFADVDKTISLFKPVDRYKELSPADSCKVIFHNAGHVLGSAFIEVLVKEKDEEKKIIFSGDLGEDDHPIVKDPDNFTKADFLVIESTYGIRVRELVGKEERLKKLAQIFNDAIKRGGNILIPAFALERTQDLLHDILVLKDRGDIPGIKVVVDSPLATNITKVFAKYPDCYDEDARNVKKNMGGLFTHEDIRFTESVEESKALNGQKGIVLLSASGMCDAGRIKHHLKHNLWGAENTVLFVGYQANGTLGSILVQGKDKVRIHGEEVTVNAKIESIMGYSGHADQKSLIAWLDEVEDINGTVFVVHGEKESAEGFAELIRKENSYKAVAPEMGESFDLLKTAKADRSEEIEPLYSMSGVAYQPKPGKDSHNLYAELMLKLADFMRNTTDENKKRTKLKEIIDKL